MLFWAYVILALPYAYRALAAGLNAVDATTLSEAARSLRGALVHGDVPDHHLEYVAGDLNALPLTVALSSVNSRCLPADVRRLAGGIFSKVEPDTVNPGVTSGVCRHAARVILLLILSVRRAPPAPRAAVRCHT